MKYISIILLSLIFFSCQEKRNEETLNKEIKTVLFTQQEAWNNGNIDAFMGSYWKSDSLTFIGSSGLTYGWEATYNNYKRSYPDSSSMGKLQFYIFKIDLLSKESVHVVGKWEINRTIKEKLSGYFTLIMKKINKKWVIVYDHSS